MKATKVLLRWYKSFNTNYMRLADRRESTARKPWNLLLVSDVDEHDYEFIEIPLETDTTTIVGANESGKSHLISAISKVITGKGIPDAEGRVREFSRTDLCHYASVRSKNADVWPNLGVAFAFSEDERAKLQEATGVSLSGDTFTLILAPDNKSTEAWLFTEKSSDPAALDKEKLAKLRKLLPTVRFIRSELAFADEVPVSDLLSAMGSSAQTARPTYYRFDAAQQAARLIESLSVTDKNQITGDAGALSKLKQLMHQDDDGEHGRESTVLERQLFADVLKIDVSAIEFLARLDHLDRSYAEGLIATWNEEIERVLNLSHYWQQDDLFRLRLNYKRGVIYFEITDKTGAVYTFRERSSGLRYFLSYYVQAKALERAVRKGNCIILMDEPDSYLSSIGQRNLLAVFESLVSADTSQRNTQLVYTTHSPFLINRNFPRRIRLVRKGDAEEGTQFIDQSILRRYEPVRSALGIDCAQTLFMGTANVVLEGPTDQFLLSELVRAFATPGNVSEYLDLNAVTLVSADSGPGIEKLLEASRWGDERNPATVVIVDDDDCGHTSRDRITGSAKQRNCKQLLPADFVATIADAISTDCGNQNVVTTEDVIPADLYAKAVKSYLERWYASEYEAKRSDVDQLLDAATFGANGVAADTKAVMTAHITPGRNGYDKMGVLQECIQIVNANSDDDHAAISILNDRFRSFCRELRRRIELSQQAEQIATSKQAISRVVKDFFIRHKNSASVFEIELLLTRLSKEVESLGDDGDKLHESLRRLGEEVRKLRSAKQERLVGEAWKSWQRWIEQIRKNPLGGCSLDDTDEPVEESPEPQPAKTVQDGGKKESKTPPAA